MHGLRIGSQLVNIARAHATIQHSLVTRQVTLSTHAIAETQHPAGPHCCSRHAASASERDKAVRWVTEHDLKKHLCLGWTVLSSIDGVSVSHLDKLPSTFFWQRCFRCLELPFQAVDELTGWQRPLAFGQVEVAQLLQGR